MNQRNEATLLGILITFAIIGALWFSFRKMPTLEKTVVLPTPTQKIPTPAPLLKLSPLATAPDWSTLDPYQYTISRESFLHQLTTYFTVSDSWKDTITVHHDHAEILASTLEKTHYKLHFARPGEERTAPRTWKKAADLPPASNEKPLANLHIAIDPGHIGGTWARMEERFFSLEGGVPVTEGDMTLHVAHLLKPMLEKSGAQVTLVRSTTDPVTPLRPEKLLAPADSNTAEFARLKSAEQLFYRSAEIRARAEKVNQQIKPDIVLCLHFNAVSWGNPAQPTLTDVNHFHLILNGAYTDDEILLDDQRHEMIQKILSGTIFEEASVGATVAKVFSAQTSLPPYQYDDDSARALNVDGNDYLWARNLLANRLYQCPVIYYEPYIMNSTEVYERVQAGAYQGEQLVAGKIRPNIYLEYATAAHDGLVTHYSQKRHRK